jgi:hypothetical protein
VLNRDQGQRRTRTVTVGLVAASVAGTLAFGAAAWAKEASKTPQGSGGDTTTGTTPGTGGGAVPPGPGAPDNQPTPFVPGDPNLTGPGGPVTGGRGPGHASSGGS